MKKIIFGVIAIVVIIVVAFFILRQPEANLVDDAVEETDFTEVIPFVSELKIKTYGFDKTYEISDDEVDLFKEELLGVEFLSDIYRFAYHYDKEANEISIVYKDQTIYINMNNDTLLVNGKEKDNGLIFNKAGNLYVNLASFKDFFPLDYEWVSEPYFIGMLDFDSNNDQLSQTESDILFLKEMLPDKINMTWEAVYSGGTKVDSLYEMPGLDIISPVWYTLKDSLGAVSSRRQSDYMEWASEMNYTLWPAVTNDFDLDKTHELLISNENRRQFIDSLVEIYRDNSFPGINIDFENIYKEDKDLLSHFMAELTAAFHREKMMVSMDVTFLGGSDTWSLCYDRSTLGEWVDFIVVMSYDEHWGSSPISGSVASLNWVDRNIALLLQEVPPEKLIMGIPFYMRVWFERPSREKVNSMRVTSDAITMHGMENILKNASYNKIWDEPSGQYYVSYIDAEDNALKKIWIEDEESLALKVELVHKYNLKGIASWRRGYETENIWPMLDEVLNR